MRRGEAIFGPTVAQRIIEFFAAPRQAPIPSAFPELTERELEVLDHIAAGHSNPDISHDLALSPKTYATTCPTSSPSFRSPTVPKPSCGPGTPASAARPDSHAHAPGSPPPSNRDVPRPRLRDQLGRILPVQPRAVGRGAVRQHSLCFPGMCTIHSNSAREAVTKLCTLPLLAGENVT